MLLDLDLATKGSEMGCSRHWANACNEHRLLGPVPQVMGLVPE